MIWRGQPGPMESHLDAVVREEGLSQSHHGVRGTAHARGSERRRPPGGARSSREAQTGWAQTNAAGLQGRRSCPGEGGPWGLSVY